MTHHNGPNESVDPASGTVRIFYGAVDGNCDMMSMHDAVVVGTRTLTAR